MSTVLERTETTAYQDYSLQRKAEVIALVDANGGNVLQTARDTGIPHQTIRHWMIDRNRYSEFEEQSRGNLDVKMDKTVHRLINSIYDHDLDNASLAAKATAFGVVFDKLQLLRGQPTSITETVESGDVIVILAQAIDDAIDVPAVIHTNL